MEKLKDLQPRRVFFYFERISAIPRGSGNTTAISQYCEDFAREHDLKYIKDDAGNVVIFKPGSSGYEKSEPIILQGHLDMVCQKNEGCDKDFETEGLDLYVDGDFLKAKNTTLGADNGIAVAIILAILENGELSHPPIEAVFTTDEEVGMLGALRLDMSCLKSKKMINMDSEEEGIVTVSCAGGVDFRVCMPFSAQKKSGYEVTLAVKGLQGGHSGVEINRGRVNADLMAGRILNEVSKSCDFEIIEINGGDKPNAIPNRCTVKVCTDDADEFSAAAKNVTESIKKGILHREPDFCTEISVGEKGEYRVADKETSKKLLLTLLCVPNGVAEMSREIEGLVETSLNLGILKTEADKLELCFALRSNKKSAQEFLVERLRVFFGSMGFDGETSGYYPPWEFNDKSELIDICSEVYAEHYGKKPEIAAIHAGLECGVFASATEGMDCISVGPEMHGVHTVNEELCISSTEKFYEIIKDILKKLK